MLGFCVYEVNLLDFMEVRCDECVFRVMVGESFCFIDIIMFLSFLS